MKSNLKAEEQLKQTWKIFAFENYAASKSVSNIMLLVIADCVEDAINLFKQKFPHFDIESVMKSYKIIIPNPLYLSLTKEN